MPLCSAEESTAGVSHCVQRTEFYCAEIARHIVLPTSSATSSAPFLSSATPTGRPQPSPAGPMNPLSTSIGLPDGVGERYEYDSVAHWRRAVPRTSPVRLRSHLGSERGHEELAMRSEGSGLARPIAAAGARPRAVAASGLVPRVSCQTRQMLVEEYGNGGPAQRCSACPAYSE